MEKWDLYTKYREKTGKEHIRGEKIPEGFYHLVVHVWIRNCKGEYLISQRAADRPTYPLMWECVGGSVIKGETSLEGAVREVKEEVGLDLEEQAGRLLFTKIRGRDLKNGSDAGLFFLCHGRGRAGLQPYYRKKGKGDSGQAIGNRPPPASRHSLSH